MLILIALCKSFSYWGKKNRNTKRNAKAKELIKYPKEYTQRALGEWRGERDSGIDIAVYLAVDTYTHTHSYIIVQLLEGAGERLCNDTKPNSEIICATFELFMDLFRIERPSPYAFLFDPVPKFNLTPPRNWLIYLF